MITTIKISQLHVAYNYVKMQRLTISYTKMPIVIKWTAYCVCARCSGIRLRIPPT